MKKHKEEPKKTESSLIEALTACTGLILYRMFLKSDNSFKSILVGILCGLIGYVIGMAIKSVIKKIESK